MCLAGGLNHGTSRKGFKVTFSKGPSSRSQCTINRRTSYGLLPQTQVILASSRIDTTTSLTDSKPSIPILHSPHLRRTYRAGPLDFRHESSDSNKYTRYRCGGLPRQSRSSAQCLLE